MATILAGLVGGLLATVVMTVVMMLVGDGGPPPTAALVAKLRGGDPEDHAKPGMLLHLLYGTGAGAVFAVGAPLAGLSLASLTMAVALGLAYGVALMVGGMVFWMRIVIGIEPEKRQVMTFAVVHVVYGIVLGGVVGAGVL